jgi:hypothetical protein
MTKRQEIAKEAARRAAKATYDAVLNAPMRKVATVEGPQKVAPSAKDIAKVAAAAAYRSIVSFAQDMSYPAPDASNVQGVAMSLGFKNLASYLGNKDPGGQPYAQEEVPSFLDRYQNEYKPGQGVPPEVIAQHVEIVKGILRDAGLNA